jgi:hypothetical protein
MQLSFERFHQNAKIFLAAALGITDTTGMHPPLFVAGEHEHRWMVAWESFIFYKLEKYCMKCSQTLTTDTEELNVSKDSRK